MLDLAKFSESNVRRASLWHGPNDDWKITDWSNAMAGEGGEALEAVIEMLKAIGLAANTAKKIRREEGGLVGNGPSLPLHELYDNFGEELADVVTYALLAAHHAHQDIEKKLVDKFNKVSIKNQFDIYMDAQGNLTGEGAKLWNDDPPRLFYDVPLFGADNQPTT